MEFIYEIEDVIDKKTCEDIIKRFELDKRKVRGITSGGMSTGIKVSIDLPIGRQVMAPQWSDVTHKIVNKVNNCLKKYFKYLYENKITKGDPFDKNTLFIGPPQIQKTEKGGYYRWHHDGECGRIITYILYLNDVEEGIGGTTDFMNGKSVQPKAGKLIFFPATWSYIHRGKKLEKGEKYILTNFIYSNDDF
jgi:hypothetical protein